MWHLHPNQSSHQNGSTNELIAKDITMTLITTQFNRRSFLKVSAAAGGGMVLGFSWLSGCMPKSETALAIPEEWFDINGFIKIGDTGLVTIFSPNPEIGQNVKTSMPMIVAEELDVDWKNVVVEQAKLNTDLYQGQIAGGSQSIRRGWEPLRMAGATARRMLMEAAANEWKVDVNELTTEKGVITHKSSGKSTTYGTVAGAAVSIPVPEEVTLKNTADFKLVGSRVSNVDAKKIITGQPLFGLDYHREGMLIAMIVHPPAFGMKLKSLDDKAARAMPGIRDVFTINTAPQERQWSDTNAFPELIAVVGTSTWEVMKAKKAIVAEWEQETPLENTEDHQDQLARALENTTEADVRRIDGQPDQAFAKAAKVIERTFTAPFLAHNTMEPMNFFADVTENTAELVGPIQTPEYMEKSISSLLGMPVENIDVKMTRMGGGFGRRLYGHFGLEAAVISQKIKSPVKLVYNREDDISQGTYRPAYRMTFKAGLNADNALIAYEVKGVGIDSNPIFANRFPAGTVENYRAVGTAVSSNISTGAWRAPNSNFTAGAEQAFLDEVAEAAGQDPIDFRLKLFERAINAPIGEKNDYEPARYAGVLKLVKEKANWGAEMPGVSRGVAAYFCHNSYVAQVIDLIKVEDQIKIKKVWCAVDCGIVVNLEGALNQIEGGIIDGIGHAMYSELSFVNGAPEQSNFHNYRLIRHTEAPLEIETFFVQNDISPTGLGEPSLPPAIGALANAMYRATRQRYYHQPFSTAAQQERTVEMI